jgi:hypothetical protein
MNARANPLQVVFVIFTLHLSLLRRLNQQCLVAGRITLWDKTKTQANTQDHLDEPIYYAHNKLASQA